MLKAWCGILARGGLMIAVACATGASVAKPVSDVERMEWWEDARFGLFVHWGIYSIPAGFYHGEPTIWSAEWIMEKGRIPIAEYETYADQFNPSKFDAEALVLLAQRAGMKYLVITAKHHDGFSMFGSKSSAYNVVDATPFNRDVMKELSEACAKHGIRFGFYYSQAQDWHHPGGLGNTWDDMERVGSDEYVYKKALPEVEQLLTEYGPISIFWWDTPREMNDEVINRLHTITTELQPAIITNDRLGEGYPGHYKTFERSGPRLKPDARYWELCQPISKSWGYRSDDDGFKPVPALIHTLIDCASKGGNYLLNVSPTDQGDLRPEAVERLGAIARWMAVNSESIYGTTASPCEEVPKWGRVTVKGTRLFLHVFDWKEGDEIVIPIKNAAESCRALGDAGRTFQTRSDEAGIHVKLAGEPLDAAASVLVLTLPDAPVALPRKPLAQDEEGVVELPAHRAQFENLQGPGAQYSNHSGSITKWDDVHSRVYWRFTVNQPGSFAVTARAACPAASAFTLSLAGATHTVRVASTGDHKTYKTAECGTVLIQEPGEVELSIMPVAEAWNPIRLRDIALTPVAE